MFEIPNTLSARGATADFLQRELWILFRVSVPVVLVLAAGDPFEGGRVRGLGPTPRTTTGLLRLGTSGHKF
jgi:hypothetical protein